ncbi:MAG: hypothetical protein AAF494_06520 [Pseudomonadota bacterium]
MAKLPPGVCSSVQNLAEVLAGAQDPWWIIGSTAVALYGGSAGTIADIDVMTSRRDLAALYERLPLTDTPERGKDMFTSDLFGRWSEPALDVEFMAGLKLRVRGEWQLIELETRVPVRLRGETVFVPDKAELIAILTRFGRPKDLARAATLA